MQGREAKMLKDNELVQIGGFNVYSTPLKGEIDLNDGRYKCVKKEGTNPQYAVFVNETTGEAVLAFNGTDMGEGDDLRTDFQLGGEGVPQMHEQALEIYYDLKNQYNIVSLCGNSLGGSLANYVSINTGIRSVTINPAVLPNDPNVNFKKDYDNNITNYIATEDPLDKLQTGLGIKNSQMPGKCVTINFGYTMDPISRFSPFLASHVGYVNGIDDDLGKSKLVMPDGYTDIYINAADYVNINPFTGKNAGETDDSFEIEINSDNFKLMSQEINQILSETQQSKVYIEQVASIAQNYNFIKTVDKREELYSDFLKTEILKIPGTGKSIRREDLSYLFKFDFPLELFVDLLRFISNTALKGLDFIGADKWARPIYCLLEFCEGLISFQGLVQELPDFIIMSSNFLFGNGLDRDLFVQNLFKASSTLQNNANILDQKLNTLKNQNDDIYKTLLAFDEHASVDMQKLNDISSIQSDLDKSLSSVLEDIDHNVINVLINNEEHIERHFNNLLTSYSLQKIISTAKDTYRAITNDVLPIVREICFNLLVDIDLLKKYIPCLDGSFKRGVEGILDFITNSQFISFVNVALPRLCNLEQILIEYKSMIKSMVFLGDDYENVILYYQSALNCYKSNVEMLNELYISIDQNTNKSVEAVAQNMESIIDEFYKLIDQLDLAIITN